MISNARIKAGRMRKIRLKHNVSIPENVHRMGNTPFLKPKRRVNLPFEILHGAEFKTTPIDKILVNLVLARFEHERQPTHATLHGDKFQRGKTIQQTTKNQMGQAPHIVHKHPRRDGGE